MPSRQIVRSNAPVMPGYTLIITLLARLSVRGCLLYSQAHLSGKRELRN